MNNSTIFLNFRRLLASSVVASLIATNCLAGLDVYSASDRPGAAPDANGGTADVWSVSLTSGDSNRNGDFQGDSAGNGDGAGGGAGSTAWGLYANNGESASATADITGLVGRPLNQIGEFVSLDFDNGWVDGFRVGVEFLDGASNSQAVFEFTAGDTEYRIEDGNGFFGTGIPFTDDGFNLKLTLDSLVGDYTLDVGGTPISSFTFQGTSSIGAIRVFNDDAGPDPQRDLFFDNLQLSTIPEPSAALFLGLIAISHITWSRFRRLKSSP